MEPVVIRARVRARLLGLPLLTLTARIVAESQENHVLLIPASEALSAAHGELDRPSGPARLTEAAEVRAAPARGPRPQPVAERGTSLARARQLVRKNAHQLERGNGIPD